MSHATTFDTVAYIDELEKAGVSEAQAKVQARALTKLVDSNLATKHDIKELDLKIENFRAELKKDIELLRKDLIIKLGSMIIGGFMATIGILTFILNFMLHH